jgi:hypothetical protein
MDQYSGALSYAVDIVFVIDVTGSMEPVLDQVRNGALTFHDELDKAMQEKNKRISSLRIRTLAYRDYLYDRLEDVMLTTDFLKLPEQSEEFSLAVKMLQPFGGGDEPESGLEALSFAIHSDWERGLDRRRHIIVLFTDAPAHPPEHAWHITSQYAGVLYPNLDELTEAWEADTDGPMEFGAKRLLLYAPDAYPWDKISAGWSNTLHYMSRAGEGLADYEFRQIIDSIANSV